MITSLPPLITIRLGKMTANKQTKLVELANHGARVKSTKTINTHLVAAFTSKRGSEYNSDDS